MPSFHNGEVEIAYLDEGEGDPILLVHGFASSKNVNWVYPTWVSELKKAGRRVIAFDNRGHGDSAKLYDSAQYEIAIMAGDIADLMDHLEIERADVMGYSLGARMTAVLARQPAAAAALGDFRRHRDWPDRGRRPRRKRRGGAGGAVARGRHRSRGAYLSRLRRPDPQRPPGAGRLPARLAPADDGGGGRRHRGAGADRGRHAKMKSRARRRRSARSFRARRCSTFPTATTCGRSATRSTRRAYWISCPGGREVRRSSQPAKCLTSAISATKRGDPCEARAVAVMRSGYHAADKGIAEQRQRDRRRAAT